MASVLLHGKLHITIFEMDRLSGFSCCNFFCKILENIEEIVACRESTPKIYTRIDLEEAAIGQTRYFECAHSNPQWDESFHIYCAHMASNITFCIKIKDPIGSRLIGRAHLPAVQLLHGEAINTWLRILNQDNQTIRSKIHVKAQFFHATKGSHWSKGIVSPNFLGVPYTFFPQRNGCRVTLYQDSHVLDNFAPKIPLAGNKNYEHHRCWEDIFDAVSNAKHFIYITGWSVYVKIKLVRDPKRPEAGEDLILGELLKKKAEEGVRVLMLVWDDETSLKLLKKDGVMATHDEDTRSYFHNTKVNCVLCPRKPENWNNVIKDIKISTIFTHHQKSLVVDSEMENGESEKRRIVSFIGGIDLCDGRYDNQNHSLFRTLNSVHKNDFYQHSIAHAKLAKGGPRQPWHDLHCKIEGAAAWDVLFNFEQRWKKQGDDKGLLVPVQQLNDMFTDPLPVISSENQESWNVQVFRSIDGGAAFGFPQDPEIARNAGLINWKDNVVDRSIQDAYINAIRRARNFIYIENQYFIGSSFSWKKSNDIYIEEIGALNLIPKELSLKIVSKIEAGERFCVYIVIPMWPEGVPESGSVQAILNWQNRTMEMMYSDIAEALKGKGLDSNPKDYLSFFCLGNRQTKKMGEYEPSQEPQHSSNYSKAQEARRFMIYVHAKMMIVDDEYIIMGSANINQRSMDGARDTEIAMGAYQPHHLATNGAKGQVHGFRMSLWYEHLGMIDESFSQPETLECVRKVNHIAGNHWNLYTSENLASDLPGHLLTYPIGVKNNGDIIEIPGDEFFPDTKSHVLGSKSELLPSILTT